MVPNLGISTNKDSVCTRLGEKEADTSPAFARRLQEANGKGKEVGKVIVQRKGEDA